VSRCRNSSRKDRPSGGIAWPPVDPSFPRSPWEWIPVRSGLRLHRCSHGGPHLTPTPLAGEAGRGGFLSWRRHLFPHPRPSTPCIATRALPPQKSPGPAQSPTPSLGVPAGLLRPKPSAPPPVPHHPACALYPADSAPPYRYVGFKTWLSITCADCLSNAVPEGGAGKPCASTVLLEFPFAQGIGHPARERKPVWDSVQCARYPAAVTGPISAGPVRPFVLSC